MKQGPQSLEPGQWFAGTGEDDRVAAARALLDIATDDLHDPNPARFEKMLVGTAARNVLRGAAANHTDKLVAQLVADLEDNTRAQFAKLMSEADPTTTAAKDAHMAIRVNRQVLLMLEKYVTLGDEAHEQLNNQAAYEE